MKETETHSGRVERREREKSSKALGAKRERSERCEEIKN